MIRNILYIYTLIIFVGNTYAGTGQTATDLSEIEKVERQQIIKELSYRLLKKENCKPVQMWSDKNSGADLDGYFFTPAAENKTFIIGGFATQSRKTSNCVVTVSLPPDNPKHAPPLLVSPVDWKLIWTDKGSGASTDGSMWEAIPPDNNYRCIGSIPQQGYTKPAVSTYRCVHKSLTEKVVSSSLVWSEKGSNADKKVTMFSLPNSYSFVAVQGRHAKIETFDLKANPVVKPDPKQVDEILAKRMDKIQQDIEASVEADLELRKKAEKVRQKQIAAEAAAEQEQQEQALEQQLAEQAEQQRQAELAEQKRLEEEAKAEQQLLAAAAEQQTEVVEDQPSAEQPEQPAVIEEDIDIEVIEEPAITLVQEELTIQEEDNNRSSGVSGLITYLLKISLVVFGIFMVLGFIIYKSVKGSKSKAQD